MSKPFYPGQTDYFDQLNGLDAEVAVVRNGYYGGLSAAPATRPDGTPMQPGDRYFDTAMLAELTFNGSIWYIPNIDSAALAAANGSAGVGFKQASPSSVPRPLGDKVQEIVSLTDYMTPEQKANVRARALTIDVSPEINKAALENPNTIIWAPPGAYKKTSGTTLGAGQQIKGAGPTNTIFSCSDAFDAFTLSSDYAGVSDCGFTSASARTANSYVKLSAKTRGNFVRRVKITNAFIGVWIADDAVINYFEDIEIVDTAPGTGTGMWINGGNDTFLNRIIMDGPADTQPAYGVRISRSQATWMTDCDMIHHGCGLQIDPDNATGGYITWCFFTNVACDLGTGDGLNINPNVATVKGLFFNNCWFSSNLNGVNIKKTGTGAVDSVFFTGCTMFNNRNRGFWAQNGNNIEMNSCRVSGNSGASNGVYAGIEIASNMNNFAVRDTRSGAIAGFSVSQSYGLLIGSGCDAYMITNNNFLGNVAATMGDGSMGSSGTREVRGNLGFKTVASGIATVALGTNVATINHGLAGSPTVAFATPSNTNLGGLDYWAGSFGASTFKINTSGNVTSNSLFSWQASLYN